MKQNDLIVAISHAVDDLNVRSIQKLLPKIDLDEWPRFPAAMIDDVLSPRSKLLDNEEKNKNILQIVGLLLEKKPQINHQILLGAARNGNSSIFSLLLTASKKQYGETELAELFVRKTKNTSSNSYIQEISPIEAAAEQRHVEILMKMLSLCKRAKINFFERSPDLLHSVISGESTYNRGEAPKEADSDETSKKIACLALLLEEGYLINHPDKNGRSVIHYVSDAATTAYLISQGADPRQSSHIKNKPLCSLWIRRREIHENEIMVIADTLIEAGAQWKDGPTEDVLRQQLGEHPLTERILRGRARSALNKFVQPTPRPKVIDTVKPNRPRF